MERDRVLPYSLPFATKVIQKIALHFMSSEGDLVVAFFVPFVSNSNLAVSRFLFADKLHL